MRLHLLLLLTSTAANNLLQRASGGGFVGSSRAKMAGSAKNNKKHAGPKTKRPKHKPTEPAGGWPDDLKQLDELNKRSWRDHAVHLRDVIMRENSSPGVCTRTKRVNCTAEMATMCAAYVMVMCFSDEMVETSLYCAWWWFPWAPILSHWKRYGWGIWSGNVDFGKGNSGGVRPLMISLGLVGAVGAWAPGLALGNTGQQALAMFLGCKKALLPVGLMVVPYYGGLISTNFKALNLWTPLLRTSVACTKRGEIICKTLGYTKAATHFLLSGLVFLSKTCMDNGIIYDLDPSFLGHKKGAKLKYMLLFVHPAHPLVDGRMVYWRIPHNKPTLNNSEATRRLWTKIQDATRLRHLKIASSKLNPQLATLSAVQAFDINADIIKNGINSKNAEKRETCGYGCNAGFFELGQFAKALNLVEYDGAGNAVRIKSLKKDHFKKGGLPESEIVKLVRDRSAPGVRLGTFSLRSCAVATAWGALVGHESSYAIDATPTPKTLAGCGSTSTSPSSAGSSCSSTLSRTASSSSRPATPTSWMVCCRTTGARSRCTRRS